MEKEAGESEHKDRKTALVFFGIALISIGLFHLISALFTLLVAILSPGTGIGDTIHLTPRMIALSVFHSVEVAVAATWLGIGSILARRWARALILVFSWIRLAMGSSSLIIMMTFLMPRIQERMSVEDVDPSINVAASWFVRIFMVGISVGMPLVFILFYGSRHVKETCDRYDPRLRWTDKCPLPVLALSIVLGTWAMYSPWSLVYGAAFPVFGTYVTGITARVAMVIFSVAWIWLAVGVYRLRFKAWVAAVILMAMSGVSSILTFARVGPEEILSQIGLSAVELELARASGILDDGAMIYSILIPSLVLLPYMLWIRKWFRTGEELQPRG